MIAIITCNLIAFVSYFSYKEVHLDMTERDNLIADWNKLTAYMLYSIFGLHLICVVWLLHCLRISRD